jgi:hypothetical protein
MSSGVRIIPPKPKLGVLRVAGFVSGKDRLVSFEGTISVKQLKKLELKPGAEFTVKIHDAASLDKVKEISQY